MNKPKIAFFFDRYGNPQQNALRAMYLNFKNGGFDTQGFSQKIEGHRDEVELLKPSGSDRLKLLSRKIQNKLPGFGKVPSTILKRKMELKQVYRDSPDVVHFFNAQRYSAYKDIIDHSAAKLSFTFRGFDTLVRPHSDPEWRRDLELIYERATCLHFVSDFIRNAALKLGAPEEKCHRIYLSVDTELFKPNKEKEPSDVINFLSVGSLRWEKGHVYAIHALADVKKAGIKFKYRLIGNQSGLAHLSYECARLGLTDEVEFLGYRNLEEIRDLLAETDIYLHPSVSDALPNAILEASAMQIPVITSTAGGCPEAVLDGKTGFVTGIAKDQEISDRIIELAKDADLRRTMGINGRKHIVDNWAPAVELSNWTKYYQENF